MGVQTNPRLDAGLGITFWDIKDSLGGVEMRWGGGFKFEAPLELGMVSAMVGVAVCVCTLCVCV